MSGWQIMGELLPDSLVVRTMDGVRDVLGVYPGVDRPEVLEVAGLQVLLQQYDGRPDRLLVGVMVDGEPSPGEVLSLPCSLGQIREAVQLEADHWREAADAGA